MSHATISISELADLLRDPACVILDTRPSAAYVGWQLNDEARGGHIPGSVNFPLAWIIKYSCEQLNPILQSQGATPDKSIVIYGYRDDRNSLMIDWLRILGFANIIILESGLEEWAADFSLPMEYLPNYEKLVHAQWVDDCFFSRNNLHSQSEKAMLFEVISDGIENYKAGHIPGALPMDLSLFENAPDWNLCRDEDLLEALLSLGIASDTLVVLYGKDPMAAARAAYILLYAGVEDVRILDGGFDAWKSFGGSIEVEVQQPTPIKSFGYEVPVRPNLLIGIDQTKSIIKEDNGVLVSVRSWAEFTG
nr:rhodanese [Chloroflexota bacterium]